jgi:hypothetical protein
VIVWLGVVPGLPYPVMVPVIDLCHHDLNPNTHIRDYRVGR